MGHCNNGNTCYDGLCVCNCFQCMEADEDENSDNPHYMDPVNHKKGCRFLLASTCAGAVECEHGYDACPKCDPCTCKGDN